MTDRYKTRIRLALNTGDRAGHTYDKAHTQQQQKQQQQQRRVTQTLRRTTISPSPKRSKNNYIQK